MLNARQGWGAQEHHSRSSGRSAPRGQRRATRKRLHGLLALPGLPIPGDFHVAQFQEVGLAKSSDLESAQRIACLSEPGINVLQQRLVYHQTRLEVPTATFQQAFDHTYVESELLEDWSTELQDIDEDPAASFEAWIGEGDPSRQRRLLDHSERAPIRRELRKEVEARRSANNSV